jgi:hypothetical protein
MDRHSSYTNGYRFATAYARAHGLATLLRTLSRDVERMTDDVQRPYLAGEVDAAIAIAQGAR